MPSVAKVAADHYASRRSLVNAAVKGISALWRQVSRTDFQTWADYIGRALAILVGAQTAAAQQADEYVAAALAAQGIEDSPAGRVLPSAFAGIASDGRDLSGLLWSPAVAAKMALAQGASPARSLASGRAALDMIVRTQVADAGRVADGVAITVRPTIGYVRLVNPPACARCLILAGRFYRYSMGFQRHPQCDCIHVPARGEQAAADEGLINRPLDYFNSLSGSEQDKLLGRAGARAVRDGADMAQVVNARRGMTAAGTTRVGTSRHGLAGQRLGKGVVRLMPETIYSRAGSREEAINLLRQHGYII
ncbi:MAG: hypothetical protein IRZ03_08510 [Acidobacterium ailaaui]|nr:hypothetical protein [Pseudacidobacterium ailaaui]